MYIGCFTNTKFLHIWYLLYQGGQIFHCVFLILEQQAVRQFDDSGKEILNVVVDNSDDGRLRLDINRKFLPLWTQCTTDSSISTASPMSPNLGFDPLPMTPSASAPIPLPCIPMSPMLDTLDILDSWTPAVSAQKRSLPCNTPTSVSPFPWFESPSKKARLDNV